jgi:hypothetical protein
MRPTPSFPGHFFTNRTLIAIALIGERDSGADAHRR